MRADLTVEAIRKAVVDKDDAAIDEVVFILTPIIHANVGRVLYRRKAGAQGRIVRQEVEDLTQEVFATLLADGGRRLLAWDPSSGSASVFFGLIAQRFVHNILNSRKQSPWTEDPTEMRDLDTTCADDDMERLLCSRNMLQIVAKRLVAGLNDRDLKLFELMYVQQLDNDTVRNMLGIGRDALYQARRRLVQRTRELAGDVFSDLDKTGKTGR